MRTFVNPYSRYEGDMVTVTIGKDKSRESVAGVLACDGEYLVVGDRRIKWDAVCWIRAHAQASNLAVTLPLEGVVR